MIRSVLLVALLAQPAATPVPSPAPPAGTETGKTETGKAAPAVQRDASLDGYKAPVDILSERMIGSASRAVRFDWRRKDAGLGFTGGQLLELNNFRSVRLGMSARKPVSSMMSEIALSWVETDESRSTRRLELTPYRQVGRPSRLELDVNVAYPLAEGVATARLGFFPATELVFSANAGLRYLYYVNALAGAEYRQTGEALFAPLLTRRELRYLEKTRPGGMQIDTARYGLLSGLGADVYFHSGAFVSPRVMMAIPVTGSGLAFWWELNVGGGWMF